jgi:N-acetylgalactosamine-N,N'-diacetylbacillosaminyl-diphospho-undecaprenol 4-alpha-N-acetylgalactosaminyltransferase
VSILRLPLAVKKLKDYCKKHSVELIVSFLNRPNYVACLAKYFGLKAKIILNEQTNSALWYNDGWFRKIFGNIFVKNLYPLADAIVPNAEGIKYLLEKNYRISENIYVTNNIVDIRRIKQLKEENSITLNSDKFTFVYVSRLIPGKGHKLLLEAFAELRDEDCRLLLLGKGYLENSLKEYAESLKIRDRVDFLGFQMNPFKYISRADCFVMTSEYEGSPNVLVEAMACGVPIISTNCLTGPRELLAPETHPLEQIKDGLEIADYGILVPVSDKKSLVNAMLRIKTDPGLVQKLRDRANERILSYDVNTVLPKYKELLKQFTN